MGPVTQCRPVAIRGSSIAATPVSWISPRCRASASWIDEHWDHTAILSRSDDDPVVAVLAASNEGHGRPVFWIDGAPTAENIVLKLASVSRELLAGTGVELVAIRLWETPNCSAEWSA